MDDKERDKRPDPDALLATLQKEEKDRSRGRLKIFFGACAGVGKTYAMLQEAKERLKTGVDVVVGLAETHGRPETTALLEGFEILPKRSLPGRSSLHEFDMQAALRRRPALLVLDELAHTNLPGSRHRKRWQDVEELLDEGIDVYTALNVQHLESLNDVVAGITGIKVRETVPDWVFDEAWEVKLVDLPAAELLRRLAEGKIYMPNVAERAAKGFFREGNIIALRELALRRTADRVDAQMRAWREERSIDRVWEAQERILVAVGSSEESARVVREAARMANRMKAEWIAVHVEDPAASDMKLRKRSFDNLNLAAQLGAETTVLSGSDQAGLIARYARKRNVTKVVLGARARTICSLFKPGLADRLLRSYPDLDIVQIALETPRERRRSELLASGGVPPVNYLWATLACAVDMAAAAALLTVFEPANVIIVVFLLAVFVSALWGIGPAVWAVVAAGFCFDYFYMPPVFEFTANNPQYLFTFGLVLLTAVWVGHMSERLRREADLACTRDFRSSAVAGLARELATALTPGQVSKVVRTHLSPLLKSDIRLALPDRTGELAYVDSAGDADIEVAQWSFDHGKEAGLGTQTLSASPERTVPLLASKKSWGVLAIRPSGAFLFSDPDNKRLLDACAAQIAQTLERIDYAGIARDALVKGEAERTRAALIGAVIQDLSRPVALIAKTAERILKAPPGTSYEKEGAAAIRSQASMLQRLTGNLKELSRLQAGNVKLRTERVSVPELLNEVARRAWAQGYGKTIETVVRDEVPELELEPMLVRRALECLIDNADKFSPRGTAVAVSVQRASGGVEFSVRDHGRGLPEFLLRLINSEGTDAEALEGAEQAGLGLTLASLTVEAHRGRIRAENLPEGGARITLWFPLASDARPQQLPPPA
ncbi:MAG: sensor histidine kinase KdpD [Mesosutterella sp.]|nr:sensor histidine kinase KdpD [Mesosutterella sp.]